MMQPIVFGLNYQTADFELRDRLAFSTEEIPQVIKRLLNSGIVKEAILLSTCNRTELYCISNDINFVINALCDLHNVCPRTVLSHSYVYYAEECAEHLFRVISGLESMVLGESEIVAQIKAAMSMSQEVQALGSNLNGLFQMALSVAKDVRNHTMINHVAISMGHALVKLVNTRLNNLPSPSLLFIGAGQMMQQIAPHFNGLEISDKLILNRTVSKALALGVKIAAKVEPLENLPFVVDNYAIIIICCAGSKVLVDEALLDYSIKSGARKLIIDLSMPAMTSRLLKNRAVLEVITIDDVARLVDVGLEKRKDAALLAEKIISTKLDDYQAWLRKRGLAPIIKRLREESDLIRSESLAVAEKQLQNGISPTEVLRQLSLQLTNRLLHNPTVKICSSTGPYQDSLVDLVNYLYGLDEVKEQGINEAKCN